MSGQQMPLDGQLPVPLDNRLRALSPEELQEVLENDEKMERLVLDSEEVQNLQLEREMSLATNRSLAESNLGLQPRLERGKAQLLEKYGELRQIHQAVTERHQKLESHRQRADPEGLLAVLQAEGAKVEDESEELAEAFLSGQCVLDAFLERYAEQRRLAHARRVRVEKLQEILQRRDPPSSSSSSTPPPPQEGSSQPRRQPPPRPRTPLPALPPACPMTPTPASPAEPGPPRRSLPARPAPGRSLLPCPRSRRLPLLLPGRPLLSCSQSRRLPLLWPGRPLLPSPLLPAGRPLLPRPPRTHRALPPTLPPTPAARPPSVRSPPACPAPAPRGDPSRPQPAPPYPRPTASPLPPLPPAGPGPALPSPGAPAPLLRGALWLPPPPGPLPACPTRSPALN
ncbi:vacuolar protein sorting-associated protein 37C isoform X1 [Hemitrygon akajei]|uniref:vacuolar protein sorting-associated protein 37C isoform X1 n=1 Tax=Hemitrygon akajei TaxID=2704970 RepID=UPI003BF9F6E2